ncbi:dermonecrotic toxin domain-containing protein [Pseudomonas sp. 18175]|uniref:dermonecrotic toxin domain-containing protein n=1 Tax=Pseudomonas sp. 18175 TaxID=3390056 RepID=UPI003D1DBC8E
MSPDTPDPIPSAFDFDDPAVTRDERLAAIRAQLTRRINTAPYPSRTLNQLHAAHARRTQATKQLGNLAGRAPRILSVIRHALLEAFALDPETLLFSEPPPPQPARIVNSLTDRALALFSDPGVPLNLHHFTALSLKDDPGRALPFNATQVLARVSQLSLATRINQAMTDYWQHLAHGSWLSRRERWVELHKDLFADQAFLAHQVFELSDAGYAMARQLVDAPSVAARHRAGGAWATLQVRSVAWPHVGVGELAIPGALHLYREGASDGVQVIYLPGLQRTLHEFCSWHQMQAELPARVQASLLSELWQYLPYQRQGRPAVQLGATLTQDALAHSANAVLDGQWHNEWASVLSLNYAEPPAQGAPLPSQRGARLLRFIEKGRRRLGNGLPFASSLDELLAWDRQRRQAQILLASLSPDLPRNHCQQQVQRYETGLAALWLRNDPTQESEAYQAFVQLEKERQGHAEIISRLADGAPQRLFEVGFWRERGDAQRKRATQVLNAQRRAWRLEAQLEHRLKLIQQTHLERLLEVLNQPLAAQRGSSDSRVLQVAVGNGAHTRYRLMGAFVVTTVRARAEPSQAQPVVLVVGGSFGGLVVFESLDDLSRSLRASFASRDGSVLWRCIGRDVRAAARFALARSVQVDYSVVDHDVLYEDLKEVIEHHARLNKLLDQPARVFSEVRDPTLGRLLLAEELRERLQVPTNEARTVALSNLDFVRFAAARAKTQPAWLATATVVQREIYTRLQRRYLSSARALESRLWQVLPQLYGFARNVLIAQLTQDGFYPQLDIDQPLLNMPDDVGAQFCGWSSQCAPGDRHVKMSPSPERTTFSLLELALHNLDPQAPWTEWRFNRARYLMPAWKDRLTPRYLVKTLSALDIGGQYNALIRRAFHPASRELSRPLIDRATQQLAQVQVYSAARQGLSALGQSLFTTAMAARSQADLNLHGHQLSLGFVRLCGHTMAHDRHLAGVLIISDQVSRRCLVYWPAALDHPVLAEHASLELARAALNRAGASAENIKALAQRVAPGWEDDALSSYPGQGLLAKKTPMRLSRVVPAQVTGYAVLKVYEAIRRFVRSFKIKHTLPAADLAAIEAQIKEQIDAEPTAWLDIVPTSHCDAQALFAHARMLEVQQRAHARATSGATLAQYREQRLGEQWDATVRGLLSFIPVIGVGISLYEMLLAARRYHLSGRPEDAVDVAFLTLMAFVDVLTSFIPAARSGRSGGLRRGLNQLHRRGVHLSRLPPAPRPAALLERFRKPFSTVDAIPLKGPGEKGVYVKNAELFVVDGDHHYPVYRRGDEPSLRVKNPGGEAEGELVLSIHEDREWSLGADAPPPSPQPGPSSAIWRPFPAVGGTDWAPPSRVALEQRMRQTVLPSQAFQSWAIDTPMTLLEAIPERGIYEVSVPPPVQRYRVVQHGGRHYRVLPEGSDVSSHDLIFIIRDRPLEHAASLDLAFWLEAGMFDQPIPATFAGHGPWTFHRPLFSESLRVSLARAFPSMTANSRTFLIERLLELSDRSRPLTATHLLHLKATLEKWLEPAAIGQTDDLLKLLRPHHSNATASIYIGHEPTTPGFDRVDFTLRQLPETSLRDPTQYNLSERSRVMQHAVRDILVQQGFVVRSLEKRAGSGAAVDFSCTHPQSDNLYYVLMRWARTAKVKLQAARGMQLSDEWFTYRIGAWKYASEFAPIKHAMDEGRLVKIVAGIQWTPTAAPTVYFVKFGSLKSVARPRRRRPQKVPRLPD